MFYRCTIYRIQDVHCRTMAAIPCGCGKPQFRTGTIGSWYEYDPISWLKI